MSATSPVPATPNRRTLAAKIRDLRDRFAQNAPRRPWWQRLLLPLVGLAAVVAGLVFLWIPLAPTSPLLVIGIPMLFCFHPRWENAVRRRMAAGLDRLQRWLEARRARSA